MPKRTPNRVRLQRAGSGEACAVDCIVRCLDCQYDLRGLPAGLCPECGRVFDADDQRTFDCEAFRSWSLRRLRVTAFVAAAMPWVQGVVLHLVPVAWLVEFGRWPTLTGEGDHPRELFASGPMVVLALLMAAAVPVGAAVSGVCVGYAWTRSRRGAWLLAVSCAGVWSMGLWILWMDPLGVLAWLMG